MAKLLGSPSLNQNRSASRNPYESALIRVGITRVPDEQGKAHEVAPLGPVRFQVECHCMAKAAEAYPGCGQE